MADNNRNENTYQYESYNTTRQTGSTRFGSGAEQTRSTRTTGAYQNKNKRKFSVKPTKDGLIALAELFLIVLVVFLVIFLIVKLATKGPSENETTESSSTVETVNTTATDGPIEPPAPKWNAGYVKLGVETQTMREGSLILVNSEYEYAFPSKMQSRLTELYGKTGGHFVLGSYKDSQYQGIYLNKNIVPLLSSMCEEMIAKNQETLGAETGDKILISSGYRSKDYQQKLYDEATKGDPDPDDILSAKPGHSEHHTGLAIDIKIYTPKTIDLRANEFEWITENAWKYGFVRRYEESKYDITGIGNEEWHFRFVDIPHAYAMKELDLCLEEYIEMLRDYTEEPLEIRTEKGDFLVYFVSADQQSDITYISVPDPKEGGKRLSDSFACEANIIPGTYTVSGNNIDGFIITVAK